MKVCLTAIFIGLSFYAFSSDATEATGKILSSRNGLSANEIYDTLTGIIYYDFNFLAEETDQGYRSEDEIRQYIHTFPEIMKPDAKAEQVKLHYAHLFEEEYLMREKNLQSNQLIKNAAIEK